MFLLLGPPEDPPARRYKDRSHGLAFIGNKSFAVHLYLKGLSSFDTFFYSSIDHLYLRFVSPLPMVICRSKLSFDFAQDPEALEGHVEAPLAIT